jgi:hypothetical protein
MATRVGTPDGVGGVEELHGNGCEGSGWGHGHI